MTMRDTSRWNWPGHRPYAGEVPECGFPKAIILPVPYDATSTWGKGADLGPEALFDALENMELFDIETGSEVHREGVLIASPLDLHSASGDDELSPESMVERVFASVSGIFEVGALPVLVGGEHSVSIGAIQAAAAHCANLSVLQLDAHSDLRPEFHGSTCNHACALHWASRHLPLVQVGIRSTEAHERVFEQAGRVFHAGRCHHESDARWIAAAVEALGPAGTPVYITVDLDVFDPAHVPDTGTPEPGGLNWYQVTGLIREAALRHPIVGMDVVELAPRTSNSPSAFTAAKLLHKMLTYALNPEPLPLS